MRTVAWFLLVPMAALAGPIRPWQGGTGRGVRPEHLALTLSDAPHYADRYTIEAFFPDGSAAYVSVLVKNFGVAPGTMTLKSRWHEPSGREHRFAADLPRGEYRTAASPFSVEARGHRIWGTPRRFHVRAHSGPYTYELRFASGLPPFRPWTGRTTFDDAGELYVDQTRVQPKAVVTGWVQRRGGPRKQVRGYGYVVHSVSTIAPHRMYRRYIQVRALEGRVALYIDWFQTPKDLGGRPVGYVYLAVDGRVVGVSRRIRFSGFETDASHPAHYRNPRVVEAEIRRKGRTVRIRIETRKRLGREDVLAGMNALKRAVVKRFAWPVNYTFESHYRIEMEGAGEPQVLEGTARLEIYHLNK